MHSESGHGERAGDLRQEPGTVGERAIGVAVEEIVRQVLVEPARVRFRHRADVAAVELLQRGEIGRLRHGQDYRRALA
jgi:hypothetical protein